MDHFKYLVTVVIPVYNNQDYIEECIKSIENQNMDVSQIEILLINDGSTDHSHDICKKLAQQYHNICYIHKENTGVSDTRNVGIKKAQGKYIMLLDSDDYLDHQTIKNLIDFFDKHYHEVDLVTYPIYWDRNEKILLHSRYSPKKYDKGTGIYDLDQYPYLNQSTVNIIFKNEFENNQLYDISMKLSEDQNFDTCLLMKKNKLGFVKKAKYYYRRHGASVSQTRNNPYYCFEDIMGYNEALLEKFQKNGQIPKYVQTLVINTFGWRIKQDQLIPYHYKGKDLEMAKQRIFHILQKIDDEVIVQYLSSDIFTKLYLLRWKGSKVNASIHSPKFYLSLASGLEFSEGKNIRCYLYRSRMRNGKIQLFVSFVSPLLQVYPLQELIITGKKRNGENFEEHKTLTLSKVPFKNTKMPTADSYAFEYIFDPQEIKSFQFYVKVNDVLILAKALNNRFCGFVKKLKKNSIPLKNYRLTYHHFHHVFKVSQRHVVTDYLYELKSLLFYPKKQLPGILYYRYLGLHSKKVWLYSDSPGVIDNAYYQFIHDFDKNDGIERYYVVDGDTSFLNGKLTKEQRKYLLKFKSKKHKELFLQAEKLLISFSSISIYSPFKKMSWYKDLLDYELVYLQHGILHASLQRMYAKEFTEIDKFVISSEFEKKNLIQNYDYSEDDLIMSGMPRMSFQKEKEAQNKILFAPSWRQYLIGYLVNNRRALKDQEFLASDFYKQIYQFLHSDQLNQLLNQYQLTLDFQLHPIFKPYQKHFQLEDVENVNLNFEKHDLSEYRIFITDFSSYQFDYVMLKRPILYFLPDEKEVMAGLHSYRSLDLKYEDAFGCLCHTSDHLLLELKQIIENDFQPQEPYLTRMKEFFSVDQDPSEKIYQELIKNKI